MELSLEAELYSPSVNEDGNYIDNISYINVNGIRCPCCPRKDKIYSNKQLFANHIKTKIHIKWLQDLNNNKSNFFVENIRLNETVKMQQQIITKLENELQTTKMTNEYLTKIISINLTKSTPETVIDLLEL